MNIFRLRFDAVVIYLLVLVFYGLLMLTISRSVELEREQDELSIQDGPQIQVKTRPIRSVEDFFDRITIPETRCKKIKAVGGMPCGKSMDGSKRVCYDEDVRLHAHNCTVYSFGVGSDMSFDHLMVKSGCEVFAFDPSVPESMVKDKLRKNLNFYPYGIAATAQNRTYDWVLDDGKVLRKQGTLDTFKNLQKKISHTNRTVHYLKMDIEGTEWEVLPQLMQENCLDNVQQLAIEIHLYYIKTMPPQTVVSFLQYTWNMLASLKEHGFTRAHYDPVAVLESLYFNPVTNRSVATCGEILYIKRKLT